jgi:hypothetical protein
MNVGRAGVVLVTMATVLSASVDAQRAVRSSPSTALRAGPPTIAQLQARVHELEAENADLARNYDLLLASCRNQAAPDTSSSATEPGARRTRNVDDDLFWIGSLDYGVTETTSAFMRFGWKVTIHNKLARNEIFDITVQFLNKDNLVIDSGHLGVQTIRAFDEQEVTGDVLIRLPGALNVVSAKAIVNRHR